MESDPSFQQPEESASLVAFQSLQCARRHFRSKVMGSLVGKAFLSRSRSARGHYGVASGAGVRWVFHRRRRQKESPEKASAPRFDECRCRLASAARPRCASLPLWETDDSLSVSSTLLPHCRERRSLVMKSQH